MTAVLPNVEHERQNLSQEEELLHHITLHLARCKEFPEGNSRRGYEITAPLDAEGMLDPAEWRNNRTQCCVRRFWDGELDRHGHLVHRPGGSGGATWMIDYDPEQTIDNEACYRLNKHQFVKGEYVSIQDEIGQFHTFQVAAVRQLKPAETVEG